MEQILRKIVVGGMYVIPFLVLLVTSSLFFPFITGKNFAFRLITEIVFFAWLGLAILNREYRPKWNWLLVAVTSFVTITLIADLNGLNPFKSIWSNYERMEGFVTIVHLYMYFLVLSSVFDKTEWKRFFLMWFVSGAVVIGYSMLQISGAIEIHQGGVRLDATFGNATYLAVFTLFISFLAFFRSQQTESKLKKKIYFSLIGLLLFILYYTATRGAMLGLLGGVGITALLIALFEKENKFARRIAIYAIAAVLLLIGGFILIKDTGFVRNSPVLARFASISLNETTTKSRFMIWDMAIEGFKERPLLGWGQENFNYVFNKHYNPGMYGQEQWFDRSHNVVLDWLVAGGLLGALAYLSMFALGLFYLWRSVHFTALEKSILTGMLSAYFINNLFVFDSLGGYLLFFMTLAFISFNSERREITGFEIKNENLRNAVVPILAVLLLATAYSVNAKGYAQGKALIRALTPTAQNVPPSDIEKFKKALSYDSFGTPEVREHLSQTVNQLRSVNIPMEQKQALFALAKSELDKQIAETPLDARHYIFTGSLLGNYGLHEDALPYFEKSLELSPKKQTMMFSYASSLLSLDRMEEAVAVMKEAYELEPNYDEAKAFYVTVLIRAGKIEEAESILKDSAKAMPDSNIVKSFMDAGYEDRALQYVEQALKDNSDNIEAYLNAASVYLSVGLKDKSIETLTMAAEKFPDFKQQADYYISEIKKGTIK